MYKGTMSFESNVRVCNKEAVVQIYYWSLLAVNSVLMGRNIVP